MAAGKNKKENKGSTDIRFRSAIHNDMVSMGNDSNKDEPHVPYALLIALLVMCIVLVVVLPVLAVMYMDMNNATNEALIETRKMKELRLLILQGQ